MAYFSRHCARARPGAERRPKADRFARQIQPADKQLARHLLKHIRMLEALAEGSTEVEEIWQPAGLVQVDVMALSEGEDGQPVATHRKEMAFPGKRPEDLVLVERRVRKYPPDRAALIYLIDRVMGTPAMQPGDEEAPPALPAYDLTKLTLEELDLFHRLVARMYQPASI